MEKFTTVTGVGVPLRRSGVDTDQIIPAVYLKRVTKTGFDDALFANWRQDPEFILNQPEYAGARVLVAGPDFGTGSSREHAVWALRDYGFDAVLAPKFADIFRGNSQKAGLLTVIIPQEKIEELWAAVEANPALEVTVDLDGKNVRFNSEVIGFEIDDYTRWRLMEGLDDIGLTLKQTDSIDAFEAKRPAYKPTTLPIRI